MCLMDVFLLVCIVFQTIRNGGGGEVQPGAAAAESKMHR